MINAQHSILHQVASLKMDEAIRKGENFREGTLLRWTKPKEPQRDQSLQGQRRMGPWRNAAAKFHIPFLTVIMRIVVFFTSVYLLILCTLVVLCIMLDTRCFATALFAMHILQLLVLYDQFATFNNTDDNSSLKWQTYLLYKWIETKRHGCKGKHIRKEMLWKLQQKCPTKHFVKSSTSYQIPYTMAWFKFQTAMKKWLRNYLATFRERST